MQLQPIQPPQQRNRNPLGNKKLLRHRLHLISGNRIISMPITSTPTNDGQFLVVSEGLKKGDRILLNGFNLKDSTVVTPRPVSADSLYRNIK